MKVLLVCWMDICRRIKLSHCRVTKRTHWKPVFMFQEIRTSVCLYRSPRHTQRVWGRRFASHVSVFTCVCLMFQEIRTSGCLYRSPRHTQRVWGRRFTSRVSVFTCVCLMFQEIRTSGCLYRSPRRTQRAF